MRNKIRAMRETTVGKVVWQGDLRTVYLDPFVGPRDILAWIPEQHASRNCERALKGVSADAPADRHAPWCDQCTCPNKAAATVRRTVTGWKAA